MYCKRMSSIHTHLYIYVYIYMYLYIHIHRYIYIHIQFRYVSFMGTVADLTSLVDLCPPNAQQHNPCSRARPWTRSDGWLSKIWSPLVPPKYQVPYCIKDPARGHNFDNDQMQTVQFSRQLPPSASWNHNAAVNLRAYHSARPLQQLMQGLPCWLFKGGSKSVQVLLNGLEAVLLLKLISLT